MLLLALLMVSSFTPARSTVGHETIEHPPAYLQHGISRVIILDIDLHHGTFSHCSVNFRVYALTSRSRLDQPFQEMERKQSHGQSTQRPNERGSN